jgi:hypothetical protein
MKRVMNHEERTVRPHDGATINATPTQPHCARYCNGELGVALFVGAAGTRVRPAGCLWGVLVEVVVVVVM